MTKFLHTADLHLGRAFKSIGGDVGTQLREARFQVPEALARLVTETGAAFVLVAGDLFDSRNPSGKVLAQAMTALGKIPAAVYAIPGNHDPGGPYGPYGSDKFRDYRERYAPNFHLLEAPEPLVLEEHGVVLLPCPATGRPGLDPTAWLRAGDAYAKLPPDVPRVAVAHGGTIDFASEVDASPEIALHRLPRPELDYVALGDWHGAMAFHDDAYRYAGTPEADKFPKGEHYRNGLALEVSVARGQAPTVTEHVVGRYDWRVEMAEVRDATDVRRLDERLLAAQTQAGRLLKLELSGSLSVADFRRLDALRERLAEVYLHAEVDDGGLVVRPGPEELEALQHNGRDPTVARVATALAARMDDEVEGAAARLALVKLYEAVES